MEIQHQLLRFINQINWILLTLGCLFSFTLFSGRVAWGVLMGGLIVTINFHLMARTLKKAFAPPHLASISSIIAKYYVRFTISAIAISLLIYHHVVHPLGLIAGLSIVMISMMLATVREITKLIFKEAA